LVASFGTIPCKFISTEIEALSEFRDACNIVLLNIIHLNQGPNHTLLVLVSILTATYYEGFQKAPFGFPSSLLI
jgi:hypothetical protein